MLRQWKLYKLPFSFAQTAEMQMSSYPGELWSNDDYYTLKGPAFPRLTASHNDSHFHLASFFPEQRMVVQETTNAILNETILSSILSPIGILPVGLRCVFFFVEAYHVRNFRSLHLLPSSTQVANRLATDGASWAAAYAPFNSGTYKCVVQKRACHRFCTTH